MSVAVFAAPSVYDWKSKSMLTVTSAGQGDIRVVMDGKRFDLRHNHMSLRNIRTGYYNVKIYRQNDFGFFDKFRSRFELVFNRSVVIRKNTNLVINIDRFGRTSIDQRGMKDKGKDFDRYRKRDDRRDSDKNNDFDNDNEFDNNTDFDKNRKSEDEEFDFDFDRDGQIGDYDNDYNNWNNHSMSARNSLGKLANCCRFLFQI